MKTFDSIPTSADPIADMRDMVDIIQERLLAVEKNPNVNDYYKEFLSELYFVCISVLMFLEALTYMGNEDLSQYRCIAEMMRRIERLAPERNVVSFNIKNFGSENHPVKLLIQSIVEGDNSDGLPPIQERKDGYE